MEGIIYTIFYYAFRLYFYAIIIYILSSWIPGLRDSKFGEYVGVVVEPYLSFFRRFIPPIGMIDISPIAAIFVYNYVTSFALSGLRTVLDWF